MERYIKVPLVEIDDHGVETIIEEAIREDHISSIMMEKVVKQRKKNSGISRISFTSVLLHYAVFSYLSHY